MHTNSPVPEYHRAWIDDGILYHEYHGEISIHNALDMEKQSLDLIREHKINIIPAVVILKEVEGAGIKFSPADWGKAVSAISIVSQISGVWVVGANEGVQKAFDLVNKLFVNNGIKFVASLAEAQAAAQKARSSKLSILDKQPA